jgi:hypothetical protein
MVFLISYNNTYIVILFNVNGFDIQIINKF